MIRFLLAKIKVTQLVTKLLDCVTLHKKLFFSRRRVVSPSLKHQSWRTTPYRLSATDYSIYSQLPSIPGCCILHSQTEDAPCHGDRGPLNLACLNSTAINVKMLWWHV